MTDRFPAALAALAVLSFAACSAAPSQSAAASSDTSALSAKGAQGGHYVQHNLVSDDTSLIPADHEDKNLVNSWGIARLPSSPWWVADNATGVSTLYNASGTLLRTVAIPGASGPAAPTGIVANTTPGFVITLDGTTAPARFIFASEDGTISAWTVATPGTSAIVVVPNAATGPATGAIYKGLAIAATASGPRLYATNFHAGTVETYDDAFAPVSPAPPFVDPGIPAGYAPFGIRDIGGLVYVTYAQQDENKEDDVPGKHQGFVSAFTEDGEFVRRVVSGGKLNAPWGLALAPASGFGRFGGKLLVGNFGDGHIVGYTLDGHEADGHGADEAGGGAYLTGVGGPIVIDGLWGLDFGNDAAAGPSTTLFFAAGPEDESHGLFGRIDFVHGGG
jgi:uncharacterized protein (TIGR03118 family)